MDKEKLDYYKTLLENKLDDTKNTLHKMKENHTWNPDDNNGSTELSNYDNHPADLGSQLYEFEHNFALKTNQADSQREIEAALMRIDKNEFGICSLCGKAISEDRLSVVPQTTLCIDCADDKARMKEFVAKKPLYFEQEMGAENVLAASSSTRFEGMDQLNDLMKYGSSDTPQDISVNRDMKEFYTNDVDFQGVVDPIDNISNQDYERQLPD